MSAGNTGLVLFAHGARDPRWAAPFEAVAARVRLLRPDVAVRLAYLEFMAPTLPEAVAALAAERCAAVEVLPLFLGTGGHLRRDLPALVQALRAEHPALRIGLHAAAGEAPVVTEAMAALAASLLPPA
jgi:sirohydrochlorin cobaltochelatase